MIYWNDLHKILIETTRDPGYVYRQPDDRSLQTWLGPKGRNPTCGGTHGQAAVSDANKEVTSRTETPQNILSNLGLLENDMTKSVFHLFVPEDWCVEENSKVEARAEGKRSVQQEWESGVSRFTVRPPR
jgi:hypothetical protein